MLLFRGSDKECLNYAGQTAYQVRDDWRASTVSCPAKYSSAWSGLAELLIIRFLNPIDILVYI